MKTLNLHQRSAEDLLNILHRLIYYGENNSALVIGPRGSGKTFLVKQVLENLRQELREKNCSDDLIIVYLSGCLQNDDKSGLVEISRQLKLENVINDKVTGSFSNNFEFLLRSFRSGDKKSKPLIFIMDEFDLFTKNKTQLLLYTLLNTIQTSTSPMCLIGITCRIDVLDLLEKRIKSRFSHRQVYTFNNYNFEEYLEMARYFLEFNGTWNKEVANSKVLKNNKTTIDELLKDKRILKLLNFQFEYDKSVSSLKNLLILPALKIKTQHITNLTFNQLVDEFESSYKTLTIDTKYLLLKGLSILELTLIVIMQELSETFVDEPFNFDLIYNSYLKFLQKNNLGHQKYERQIILKAYEHLILLKFILPASDNSSNSIKVSKVSKEHSLMYLALDKCEIQKCITEYPNCPTELSMLLRA